MKDKKQQKRGALGTDKTLVAVWLPNPLVAAMDHLVKKEDTDRSKVLRKALRTHLGASGGN